jgi:hypothetical protein
MTQALNFTEAKIARVIRAARKEGIVGGITVHPDGSITVARDKEDKRDAPDSSALTAGPGLRDAREKFLAE